MHDANGVEIHVGDKVVVEFVVRDLYPTAETCNVTLTRANPSEQPLTLMCQAKQTVKVDA